ncbi:MAG: hypothetical protein AB7F41_01100 [Methylocystis sp.]
MTLLLHSNDLSAVLTSVQKGLELTENFVVLAATVALVVAFFALIKGA